MGPIKYSVTIRAVLQEESWVAMISPAECPIRLSLLFLNLISKQKNLDPTITFVIYS